MPDGIDINKINLMANRQELFCGGTKVECIKAPGHTLGSMLFLIDGKHLFTGDAFRISKGNILVHPFTMDTDLVNKTIEQLKNTIYGSSIVMTAHYGYFDNL